MSDYQFIAHSQFRNLGNTGLQLSPIGFGAFKIGRNQKVKYPQGYALPDESTAARLLNDILDAGINYIDTAPAYGLSEERIGRAISSRRKEFYLSTKVGETFQQGVSTYDFSRTSLENSIERSLRRLKTDRLDIVLIHSPGNDIEILENTDVVETLEDMKQAGKICFIGLSGKDPAAASSTLAWADVVMIEYHRNDRSHEQVICSAAEQGVGVIIKKGLAAGQIAPSEAIPFLLEKHSISSVVIGGLNISHMHDNLVTAANAVDAIKSNKKRAS